MPKQKQTDEGSTGFQRSQQQRRRGMKLLRLWVPDPHLPGFATEARRQGLLLRGAAEEAESLAFIAAAFEAT